MTPAGRSLFKNRECHPGSPRWANRQPPARAAPSLVRALRDARGALLFATGTSLPQRQEGSFLHADRQATEKKRPQVEKILLPPAARLKNEKRPFPLRTKNCQHNPNNRLTGKAPYKFESISLQQGVCKTSVSLRRPPVSHSLWFKASAVSGG